MLSKSLASRKRPPRSSWTRSIWRVITTAWVTPRYLWSTSCSVTAQSTHLSPETTESREDLARKSRGRSRAFSEVFRTLASSGHVTSPTFARQRPSAVSGECRRAFSSQQENPIYSLCIYIHWTLAIKRRRRVSI